MKTILDKKVIRDRTFKYWAALPEVDRIALQADIYAQLFTNEAFIQADTIIVLEEGKMVGKGTHEELKKTNETYQEIMESQMKEEEM